MADELARLDATAQAELVRSGEASPRELVDAAIERIERTNPDLNAVILRLDEKARQAADDPALPDGPFRGVPILVKDLLCRTAGDPYTAGMRMLQQARWVDDADSWMAARLRKAGFIIVGKTNTPELGSTTTTEPLAHGPSRNPWNLEHSPGGSSGGSASAVAGGLTAVAEANDGGGSIRIPASTCGLVGLKPARGRISLGPQIGDVWTGYVAEGVVSRSVRDTAAVLDVVHGSLPGDHHVAPAPARPYLDEVGADPGRLRIGLLTRAPNDAVPVDPECVTAAERTARLLETLGHRVDVAHPAALDREAVLDAFTVVVTSWVAHDLEYWSKRTGVPADESVIEGGNLALATAGRTHSAATYIDAVDQLQCITRDVVSWFTDGYDLLLTPTIAVPPARIGDFTPTPDDPDRGYHRSVPFAIFTSPFNVTGQPAISLPLHWSADGLPIGSQLVAAPHREDLLIRIAAQLEQAAPWADRRPPVHA